MVWDLLYDITREFSSEYRARQWILVCSVRPALGCNIAYSKNGFVPSRDLDGG